MINISKKISASELKEKERKKTYNTIQKALIKIVKKHGESDTKWAITKFVRELTAARSKQKKLRELENELQELKKSTIAI